MAIALLATDFISVKVPVSAAQATSVVISEDNVNLVVKPGETTHISLPIKAVGSTILLPEASLTDENGLFTFTKPTLLTSSKVTANSIPEYATTYVEFDVKVKETAEIGVHPVRLNITAQAFDFVGEIETYKVTMDFNLRILEEKIPTQLTIGKVNYNSLFPGVKRDISFNINNEGEVAARNVYISLDFTETGLKAGYTTKKIKVGDILPGENQYITLPIEVLPTATSGQKTIKVNFEYKDIDGNKTDDYSYNINVNVNKNEKAPFIVIEGIDYGNVLKPGDEFVLKANLANVGQSDAQNIAISVDQASLGIDFIKDYYTDYISVPNMGKSSKRTAEIPLIVSRVSDGGPKELKLNITFTDASGVPYTITKSVYIDIYNSQPQPGKDASIIVSSVTQYPAQPVAGERMEVSFVLENRGTVDITELKILLENMMTNTFIPVESEPYQYFERLEGGKNIKVTIPLIVSDNITEGLNNLGVKFDYDQGSDSVTIPILNVQNDLGRSAVPKLIVNDYSTDLEEIKAGSIFQFTYSIQNTHATMAARNIKVTVTFEPDNVFALTQGSNTVYISNIAAGDTISNTIELKAKTDAKTGPYPINIQMDYEYEGAKPNESGQVGTQEKAELKLQVIENARPVVDYVNVYSWDGNVMVFAPATLAFEFYNMGKSDLYNVVATVEGDFTKSDGSMYVLGNVMPGGNAYAEFEVIPNMEGMAKGVVKITFEDSNGDLVEFSKDFETMVMGEQVWEPIPGEDSGEVFNPGVPTVKKEILPLWMFILINAVVFLAFIPITRKIIISIYKRKLRKREEEQY